jgi:hypothetical protein
LEVWESFDEVGKWKVCPRKTGAGQRQDSAYRQTVAAYELGVCKFVSAKGDKISFRFRRRSKLGKIEDILARETGAQSSI